MTKIYIGGLPYEANSDHLSGIFKEYGEIRSARVIMDRDTGQSRGFGFVEMYDSAGAKRAIEELNEAEFGGRTIHVNEARPPQSSSQTSAAFRNYSSSNS